ncbi:MAG: hypothetical protein DELT_00510 [Desulfovibrio sp.]
MIPVKFSPSVTIGGKKYASINMKCPTIGDEEDAQDMAIALGKPFNPVTAEICTFAVLTGFGYDDIRTLPTWAYQLLRPAYDEAVKPHPTQAEATPPQEQEMPETDETDSTAKND